MLKDVELLADWETVWPTDRFPKPFAFELDKGGPGRKNGRQCNKGYLLGQGQSSAKVIVVTCPNALSRT